jgi:uridine phosphorylase
MRIIEQSELIINKDGSIFHLHLKPEQIAETIILVGDPGRVELISSLFDKVEFKIQNREFITHTGYYNNKRFSVIATGIGTDNIDIVINELDALVNIDLDSRQIKQNHKTLNFIRVGTSGALQEDLDINSFLLSEMSIGFDGLLNFYKNRNSVCELDLENKFIEFVKWNSQKANPYVVKSSNELNNIIGDGMTKGITISAPGFYGPQGRVLRLEIEDTELNDKIREFSYNQHRITNYEMESSALFGLSKLLGHNAACICVIIANRYSKQYSKDYKPAVKSLIKIVLDRLSKA